MTTVAAASAGEDPALAPRAVAFAVTWTAYATYYFGRKGLSVAKRTMEQAFGPAALYGVETAFLAAYCVGQWLSGGLCDRLGARRLLTYGMLLSAAACVAYGLSSAWIFFLVAMAVNGVAQATGWPGTCQAMAEWTPPSKRGVTMGLWSTCYQVGGVAASWFAAQMLGAYGFRGAFIGPAVVIALVGALVFALLRPGPVGRSASHATVDAAARAAARRGVLGSVAVWSYGACYLCIKLIRYSLLLWLPYYLEVVLHYDKVDAGRFSTSFEIGGIAGSIGLGLLSDRFRRVPRAAFAAASLVLLAGALRLYIAVGGTSVAANFCVMALVGALLFGPDALVAGAAAQDAGGVLAAGMAGGMVNGIGSIGGVLQEIVTRGVSATWGWNGLFYVFVALALLAAASLAPALATRPRSA